MFVAIAFNAVAPDAREDERDVLVQVESVEKAIQKLGYRSALLPATLDLAAFTKSLHNARPDVVFNLVESLDGADRLAPCAAAAIEQIGLPITGSPADALWLSNHKTLAKQQMQSWDLPTPAWFDPAWSPRVRDGSQDRPVPPMNQGARMIIKPRSQHASFGMDESSVVEPCDLSELARLVQQRSAAIGQTCFAEQFIEGREFNVSLLAGETEAEVLPLAEIDFSAFPAQKPRIVDFKAKWMDGSFEYQHTPRRFLDLEAEPNLHAQLVRLARDCWQVFQLGGYARVDFRVGHDGRPWILEVNTNPCLSPDAGFAAALRTAKIEFHEAVDRILADAVRRHSDENCRGAPVGENTA